MRSPDDTFPMARRSSPRPTPRSEAAVAAATRTALLKLMPAEADGDRGGLPGGHEAAARTGPATDRRRRRRGAGGGRRPRPRAPAMARPPPTRIDPTRRPESTCRRRLPAVPHWGKRRPWVMTSGDQFRPGPPPGLTSDDLDAGLQRDQGDRREEQHPAHPGADRHRPLLGGDGPDGLLARGALGGDRARSRRDRQCSPAGGGRDGHGRRAHRRLRRQVRVQLLASDHGHPQRRPRRQRRHRSAIRAGRRSSTRRCTPSIRAPIASCPASLGAVLDAEIGSGTTPTLTLGQPDRAGCRAHLGQRRRFRAGSRRGAHLRRRAFPQFHRDRYRDGQSDRRPRRENLPWTNALATPSPLYLPIPPGIAAIFRGR